VVLLFGSHCTYRNLSSIYLCFVRPSIKIFPELFARLTVNPWMNFSSVFKAAQNFSYCTISSSLPLPVIFHVIVLTSPGFTQKYLSYIKFDTLENYTLKIVPYILNTTSISIPQFKHILKEDLQTKNICIVVHRDYSFNFCLPTNFFPFYFQ
jgi:hypothetical protein